MSTVVTAGQVVGDHPSLSLPILQATATKYHAVSSVDRSWSLLETVSAKENAKQNVRLNNAQLVTSKTMASWAIAMTLNTIATVATPKAKAKTMFRARV